jgi:hypothetical protein
MNNQIARWATLSFLAADILVAGPARPVRAGMVVSVTPYSSDWQSIYQGFAVQENFGSTTLAPGLSITLQGGAFPSAQTYTSLPQLFDPTQVAGGDFGGPFLHNTWDGTDMVTNLGYDASKPSGQNWINAWAPAVTDSSQQITFNFSQGVTSLGIGLSNFQSTNPPSPEFPVTNHLLLINGVALPQDLETLAGSNWSPGEDVRNGYLTVTATAGTVIQSIGFYDINAPEGVNDGLNFGALGFTPQSVPESSGLHPARMWCVGDARAASGVAAPAGLSRRPRKAVAVIDCGGEKGGGSEKGGATLWRGRALRAGFGKFGVEKGVGGRERGRGGRERGRVGKGVGVGKGVATLWVEKGGRNPLVEKGGRNPLVEKGGRNPLIGVQHMKTGGPIP